MSPHLFRAAVVVAVALTMLLAPRAGAQPRKEPLADRVQRSIQHAVENLFSKQRSDGDWEHDVALVQSHKGGASSLVVLALLNAGVPKDHPKLVAGLNYLRKLDSEKVYVKSLQTMALAEANLAEDRERLSKNVRWLLDARAVRGGKLEGWGYGNTNPITTKNASTTQYAVLALWAAKQAGIDVPREAWQQIRDYYVRYQDKENGFWIYDPDFGPTDKDRPSLTMTTAGLSGLLIAGNELNAGREVIQKDGRIVGCGMYDENSPAARGLRWLAKNFRLRPEGRVFYHLYGLERAGRLSGLRYFGEHDWYREGCEYLVSVQQPDGSWREGDSFDRFPIVNTSFALLFLSKGRTPVLVSKLVHGNWPRVEFDIDWNSDRNDLKHLVAFSSKELYKGLPLAWQTFDLMYAVNAGGQGATPERQADVLSDLLQSPVLYITGHKSPRTRVTEQEHALIRRYVENGGFILAEACCGSPAFDSGFKALVKDIWGEDAELVKLDGNHPVWSSFFAVAPGDPYELWGLSLGCKTVLVYSPQDLSCYWESGAPDRSPRHDRAFKLGANIIAYATGMQPPRPRGSETQVAGAVPDALPTKRGYFQAGQVYWPGGDWQPAPKAMRKVMEHVRTFAGIDVMVRTAKVAVHDESVVQHKFLYMHGKLGPGQAKFPFAAEQLKHLRFNLETGGLLLADACCGDENFDKAFREFMTVLFPKAKLEPVPLDDVLFGKELNGEVLSAETLKCRTDRKSAPRPADPQLEGIKGPDGRWVVLYSRYDLGCALEGHQSLGCLGYDPPSALKLATAAVLYNLRP